MIANPILRGFNADPSICRVGQDFYIATSTFEWYPGVQVHHSRNLVDWNLVNRPLNRPAQLDMRGNPDSCGVWAPCLSWSDGKFWLVYTDVKRYDGAYKDSHNYIVTADNIEGPWSDPVYANSSGFDPSLFHDDDGRKWFVNMVWDYRGAHDHGSVVEKHRERKSYFGGIVLQEFDAESGRLTGPITNIFRGTDLDYVEAPHMHKRGDWYYLITAEGGTGYTHAVTHCRSRSIGGPYELHPDKHVITAKDSPDNPLQRTGHGQFVELDDGSVYHTFLCSRPLPGTRLSPMGRETGIVRCRWGNDNWLYLDQPGIDQQNTDKPTTLDPAPDAHTEAPAIEATADDPTDTRSPDVSYSDWSGKDLPIEFQWLRSPYPERLFSLTERKGCLRLYGRESIGSWFEQSLVARRQTEWRYSAATAVEYEPENYQQLAGLTTYYGRNQFHYLYVTANDIGERLLMLQSCAGGWPESALDFPLSSPITLPASGKIWLGVDVDLMEQQFRYSLNGKTWQPVGPVLDASLLSDEGGRGEHACFTGNFIAMAAQDTSGAALPADFHYFEYATRLA